MTRARITATVVTLVAAVAVCLPASAVQTDHFGLQATGTRSKIIYPPGNGPVHDSVLVYNRIDRPLTVRLDVIGVTRDLVRPSPSASPTPSYQLGGSGQGFASDVHLATTEVRLPPNGRQTVGLTIDRPSSSSTAEYAAVTGVELTRGQQGGVAVEQRLAVLVGIEPGTAGGSGAGGTGGGVRILVIVIAAVLVLSVAAALIRRRRQESAHD